MTEAISYQPPAVSHQLDLQRISVKILTDAPPDLNLDPFLSIFSRWRTETEHPARWMDLADYAHMPRGPGIVLIGHMCNFSFDLGSAAPGILYVTKKGLEGALEDRIRSVLRDCFAMSRRLVAEQEFPTGVHLLPGSLKLAFNDRLETPNSEPTDRLLRPVIAAVLDDLLGAGAYEMRRQPDPGKRYGFSVHSPSAPALEDLISRLRS